MTLLLLLLLFLLSLPLQHQHVLQLMVLLYLFLERPRTSLLCLEFYADRAKIVQRFTWCTNRNS